MLCKMFQLQNVRLKLLKMFYGYQYIFENIALLVEKYFVKLLQ